MLLQGFFVLAAAALCQSGNAGRQLGGDYRRGGVAGVNNFQTGRPQQQQPPTQPIQLPVDVDESQVYSNNQGVRFAQPTVEISPPTFQSGHALGNPSSFGSLGGGQSPQGNFGGLSNLNGQDFGNSLGGGRGRSNGGLSGGSVGVDSFGRKSSIAGNAGNLYDNNLVVSGGNNRGVLGGGQKSFPGNDFLAGAGYSNNAVSSGNPFSKNTGGLYGDNVAIGSNDGNLFGGKSNSFGGKSNSFGGNAYEDNSFGGKSIGRNALGANSLVGGKPIGGNVARVNSFGGNTLGGNVLSGYGSGSKFEGSFGDKSNGLSVNSFDNGLAGGRAQAGGVGRGNSLTGKNSLAGNNLFGDQGLSGNSGLSKSGGLSSRSNLVGNNGFSNGYNSDVPRGVDIGFNEPAPKIGSAGFNKDSSISSGRGRIGALGQNKDMASNFGGQSFGNSGLGNKGLGNTGLTSGFSKSANNYLLGGSTFVNPKGSSKGSSLLDNRVDHFGDITLGGSGSFGKSGASSLGSSYGQTSSFGSGSKAGLGADRATVFDSNPYGQTSSFGSRSNSDSGQKANPFRQDSYSPFQARSFPADNYSQTGKGAASGFPQQSRANTLSDGYLDASSGNKAFGSRRPDLFADQSVDHDFDTIGYGSIQNLATTKSGFGGKSGSSFGNKDSY